MFEDAIDKLELLQPQFVMSVGDLIDAKYTIRYFWINNGMNLTVAVNADWRPNIRLCKVIGLKFNHQVCVSTFF